MDSFTGMTAVMAAGDSGSLCELSSMLAAAAAAAAPSCSLTAFTLSAPMSLPGISRPISELRKLEIERFKYMMQKKTKMWNLLVLGMLVLKLLA